jgi:WD40 repeat protein
VDTSQPCRVECPLPGAGDEESSAIRGREANDLTTRTKTRSVLVLILFVLGIPDANGGDPGLPVRALIPFSGKGGVAALQFSPDGKTLAAGDHSQVILWEVKTGGVRATLKPHHGSIRSIAFLADGKQVITASEVGTTLKMWMLPKATLLAELQGHAQCVPQVVITPDGATLASGDVGGSVKLWSLSTKKEDATLRGTKPFFLHDLACSPDGKALAVAGDTTRRVLSHQKRPSGEVRVWTYKRPSGEVRVWDLERRCLRLTLRQDGYYITRVTYSVDGKSLATSSYYGTIQLWDSMTGKVRATLSSGLVQPSVVFSPDGNLLVVAGSRLRFGAGGEDDHFGEVRIVDSASLKKVLTLNTPGEIHSVAFSPDGRLLALAGSMPAIYLLDATAIPRRKKGTKPE